MASSYALPASAMTHSHHGHVHSQSHSPGRPSANTPKAMRQERSNGSLHAYSASESNLGHIHEHHHSHEHVRERSPLRISHSSDDHVHETPHHHVPERASSPSPYEVSAYEAIDIQSPTLDDPFGMTDDIPIDPPSYQPPVNGHHHAHTTTASATSRSQFSNFILPFVLRWPLIHTILVDKDSRRIFYFMSLNFAFMLVQACYGFLTDSLGLLSDSIHMFFDCLALGVGLFAAVASKWPPSERFPYGFGKIESLSGFGNGVFLMLISIEITTEATERLFDGRETKRLAELFLVSSMGLAVNLIGMACFGHHGHAGHDHGSHSHGHSHVHEEKHSHDERHHHTQSHNDAHDHCHEGHHHTHSHNDVHNLSQENPDAFLSDQSKTVAHGHSHDNENMHGIFLHVLADTMGSAAVIVSTALIHITGWNGWDPLASCIIAVLIFMSSIPLIKSSAKKLLLTVPDSVEYNLRDALGGVGELRGVASYSVPRFWMGDRENEKEQVMGVIHVLATRGSELDEVKDRVRAHLLGQGMDVVVQVEKDGDASCWCGGSSNRSPSRFS